MNRSVVLKSIAGCAVAAALLAAPVEAEVGPIVVRLRVHNIDGGGGSVRVAMFDRAEWLSPREPVGFSNGVAIRFGPHGFDGAAIEIGADGAAVSVRLR